MKSLYSIAVLTIAALTSSQAQALDLNEWARTLERQLGSLTGSTLQEGSKDYRNDLGTGSVKKWWTNAGSVSVSRPNSGGEGQIIFRFTGTEKVQKYKLWAHQSTHYNHRSNCRVTANYAFAFSGKVYITSVRKHGTSDRVGNGVVAYVRRFNGRIISTKTFLRLMLAKGGDEVFDDTTALTKPDPEPEADSPDQGDAKK